MEINRVEEAVEEALRFLSRAEAWLAEEKKSKTEGLITQRYIYNPKLSGALRRSSLDLTRSLSALRARE